jgi:hypothetical protein
VSLLIDFSFTQPFTQEMMTQMIQSHVFDPLDPAFQKSSQELLAPNCERDELLNSMCINME